MSATPLTGSAERWGPLWGARPRDWAASEEQQTPTYEAALSEVGVEAGATVLDIGCGSGVFLRLAADRGARAFGVDASAALLELARKRVPEADLRLGEMEALPFDDDRFDLVTGFNSFFFATDMVTALREAGRVAKSGAAVVIQVWGAHERCDLEAMKEIVRPYLPPRPPDAPAEPELWRPGALEAVAVEAGLDPASTFDLRWAYEFSDREALGRAMLAPAGIAALVGPDREEEVRRRIVEGLEPQRTPEGGYRLQNEFHFVIARA
ncbi:MAG TPA: class I SAM-dependent methyltransferase [Solirubrobacterales bacterium]|jgi:SAM-dependent methyltransferase